MASIPHFVSLDFAQATQTVLYVMCGIMAFAGVVALLGLQRGRQETVPSTRGPSATAGRSRLHGRPCPAAARCLTARRRRGCSS